MRGPDERQAILFSYRSIEDRIPADHPLRAMRRLVDPVLGALVEPELWGLCRGSVAVAVRHQAAVGWKSRQVAKPIN